MDRVRALVPRWRGRLANAYLRADGALGGSLSVLRSAMERFTAVRGSQAAASLSYYAFFSLFPLLLLVLLAVGALLGREQAHIQVIRLLGNVLPIGQDVVRGAIEQSLSGFGGIQLLAALGLLWSATGFFSTLVANIDLCWPQVKAANPVRNRLYGLLMVGVLTLLLLLSLLLNVLVDLLLRLRSVLPMVAGLLEQARWPTNTRLLVTGVGLLLLFGLYWAVPKAKVSWQAAGIGALVTTAIMSAVSWGFSLLVARGITRYETVYGSLGAVVGLLFWMYLSSWVVLCGAHLTAAIDRRRISRTDELSPLASG